MELKLVTQEYGAACTDGTAPGYYFAAGFGDGVNKFIIYFMGGGFC